MEAWWQTVGGLLCILAFSLGVWVGFSWLGPVPDGGGSTLEGTLARASQPPLEILGEVLKANLPAFVIFCVGILTGGAQALLHLGVFGLHTGSGAATLLAQGGDGATLSACLLAHAPVEILALSLVGSLGFRMSGHLYLYLTGRTPSFNPERRPFLIWGGIAFGLLLLAAVSEAFLTRALVLATLAP